MNQSQRLAIEAELLQANLGPLNAVDLSALQAALSEPSPPAVRLRSEFAELPFPAVRVPWYSAGRWVEAGVRPAQFLEFAAGDYYIQDASSLLAVALLAAEPGECVLDLCASPGGKATAILDQLGESGWLLANEAVRSRLGLLEFNLARHGRPRFAVSSRDPDDLAERLGEIFDAVLVDAPCSGQSLLAKGKQAESAFFPRTVEHCAARELRILSAAAQLVRPGGRLVYSTCTFAYAENEGCLEAFLAAHPDWQMEPLPALAKWESPCLRGSYRLWPHQDGCAGGFAARLRKPSDEEVLPRKHKGKFALQPLKLSLEEWGEFSGSPLLGNNLQAFAWQEPLWEPLRSVAISGPEMAFCKKTAWFPAYSLALRRSCDWQPHACVEISPQEAVAYLQGETVPSHQTGWCVVTACGKPLGWGKGDGRLLKNHLPKPARLKINPPA